MVYFQGIWKTGSSKGDGEILRNSELVWEHCLWLGEPLWTAGRRSFQTTICYTQTWGSWRGNGHLISKSLKQAAVCSPSYSLLGLPLETSNKVLLNSCLTNIPNVPSQNSTFLYCQQILGWKMWGQRGSLTVVKHTQGFWGRKWDTNS